MAAESVWPERFLSLSGMVDARRIFSGHSPDRDPFELNYLSRAGRQLGPIMAPVAATKKGTRFLFIHGDKDEIAPYADAAQFAKRLNEETSRVSAEISVVQDMGHSPETQKDYEAIIAAIDNFIGDARVSAGASDRR
jgi:pimeloyl-ACP methyl ester carboxylesterase